jgi:glucosyl-3-phosphoglycerate synthase
MLGLWWPELTGIVQPLAGEWAARGAVLESLPIPIGYGIELAVLPDTARDHGLEAIAQVDLGRRDHKHQASHDLAVMAAELMLVAERRRQALPASHAGVQLWQFVRKDGEMQQHSRHVPGCP